MVMTVVFIFLIFRKDGGIKSVILSPDRMTRYESVYITFFPVKKERSKKSEELNFGILNLSTVSRQM